MRILFASAEMAPLVRVGGMAEANAGLVRQLRAEGIEVTVALPDYANHPLANETVTQLADVPRWAGHATARHGTHATIGDAVFLKTASIAKPHPYTDERGEGFADNDVRFFGFSAALAAWLAATADDNPADDNPADVVHLNDWHTAATLGFFSPDLPTPPALLTIHTLGYQGVAGLRWLGRIPRRSDTFAWFGGTNPLLGGIRLADRVVTVSPNYAREILGPEHGAGLDEELRSIGDRLVGIVNGIDVAEWNPATDEHLVATYSAADLAGKALARAALHAEVDLPIDDTTPLIGMVTRLVDQKGIDMVAELTDHLARLPARLVVLGSGSAELTSLMRDAASRWPDRVAFRNDYDVALGHRIFAGSDLFLMPSRFEPCGLAQMQAMAYGTIPVVTAVGGLVDTVVDADDEPRAGTGFVAHRPIASSVVDALHRAVRAWQDPSRRAAIQQRGMTTDWSWTDPAARYIDLYRSLLS